MSVANVAIIDGGGANIASLQYALERLGAESSLTSDADTIATASHVVLPGVGAAAAAMKKLRAKGLDALIPELKQPVLGICLGMQLLCSGSDEDDVDCLGVFPGRAEKLQSSPETPVPNMGWCRLTRRTDSPLLGGIDDESWFYFVHSYALPIDNFTMASASHVQPFSAVVAKDNFFAAQFHPERSSAAGAQLLRNFLALTA